MLSQVPASKKKSSPTSLQQVLWKRPPTDSDDDNAAKPPRKVQRQKHSPQPLVPSPAAKPPRRVQRQKQSLQPSVPSPSPSLADGSNPVVMGGQAYYHSQLKEKYVGEAKMVVISKCKERKCRKMVGLKPKIVNGQCKEESTNKLMLEVSLVQSARHIRIHCRICHRTVRSRDTWKKHIACKFSCL